MVSPSCSSLIVFSSAVALFDLFLSCCCSDEDHEVHLFEAARYHALKGRFLSNCVLFLIHHTVYQCYSYRIIPCINMSAYVFKVAFCSFSGGDIVWVWRLNAVLFLQVVSASLFFALKYVLTTCSAVFMVNSWGVWSCLFRLPLHCAVLCRVMLCRSLLVSMQPTPKRQRPHSAILS